MNGSAPSHPLAGWVIAILGSMVVIGKPSRELRSTPVVGANGAQLGTASHDEPCLTPVYVLQRQLMQTQGGAGIATMAFPLLMLASVRRLFIGNAPTIAVDDLSAGERKDMLTAVQAAEKMIQGLRAAESGIMLAGADTKLPPMPGRQ